MATVAAIYCSTNDYRTAKDISIGQCTIRSQSEQHSTNWGGSDTTSSGSPSHSTNWGGGRSTSYNEVARLLIRPEEILQMPRQLSIVLMPGLRPVLTEKLPYYRRIEGKVLSGGY